MRGSSVLVTGGAGFIGSHVCDALVGAGHRVLVLDDLSSGRRENLPPEATLVELDVRDPRAAALVRDERIEAIFHLAAQIDVRRSVTDPRYDADINIGGLLNLLGAAPPESLRQVVFSSTGGAIYGVQDVFPAPETHPSRPQSPYGVAKYCAEQYLSYYQREHGLDVACLRYANVYGPRQDPHGEAGVVAIFAGLILAGRPVTIFGDGGQTRDYTYVGDVAAANLAALGRPGFHLLNVGTGVETTVVELYETMCALAGAEPQAQHAPERPGEQRRSAIDATRIRSEWGVPLDTSLDDGLARAVAWFRERLAAETSAPGA